MDPAQAKSLFEGHFARLEKELAAEGEACLALRRAAISRFAQLGFPTTKHEEWKYTNVAPVVEVPYRPAVYHLDGLSRDALEHGLLGTLAKGRIVFVNGYFSPELSALEALPEGVEARSLRAALKEVPERLGRHLARYASYEDQAFVALNTAFMRDGAFIYVPRGKGIAEPIQLLFVAAPVGEPAVSYPRNLILAESGSRAQIVESYVGLESSLYFTNAVTELVVGENAVVDHYRDVDESARAFHIATLQVLVGRNSSFTSHAISLGGALVRNEINVVLDGTGSECTLNGLYLLSGEQHVDNHTRIDHLQPHCTSRELYKGVLEGRARGVFSGKIVVHKSAPKTDAKQTNKNLLLSRDALVDTKPQLEIHNNDVRCTHATTVGQLDPDALFYLRARGVGLEAARSLLIYGFASEVISRIRIEPIRAKLDSAVMTRFGMSRVKEDL